MSTRRLIVLLLGLWLGGSLFLFGVATYNFRSVDLLLASPSPAAAKMVELLGHDSARLLLRHQAGELNRFYFEYWGLAQVALGGTVFSLFLFATREGKRRVVLSLVLLLIAAGLRFILTPDLVNYGRRLDFDEGSKAEYARFHGIHRVYGIAEVVKLGLSLVLLGMLLKRSKRRRRPVRHVHVVDDADDRHIDR